MRQQADYRLRQEQEQQALLAQQAQQAQILREQQQREAAQVAAQQQPQSLSVKDTVRDIIANTDFSNFSNDLKPPSRVIQVKDW